jgi:hypothetical protein
MLEDGVDSNATDTEIEGNFQRFLAIENVIVVKVTSLTPPKYVDTETFESGSAQGEAHVYTVAGPVYHGGVRFSAKNHDTVKVELMNSDEGLLKDLGSAAASAISGALKAQLGGNYT